MRILHISAQKPDHTGSGIYLSNIIKSWSDNYEQSLIVGIDVKDDIDIIKNRYENKVEVYPLIYNSGELNFDVVGMSDNMPYKSSRYRDLDEIQAEKIKKEFSKVAKKAVEKFNPDIIICHHLYYTTSITRELFPNKKVIAICHGTCLRQIETNDFMKKYIKKQIPRLDLILALHEEQKKEIEKIYEIEPKKIEVLGSGYDNSIFYRNNEKKQENKSKIRICYAGKIAFSKGVLELVKALNLLSYDRDDLEFVIIGEGNIEFEKNEIKKEAKKSRYEIKFMGRLDQKTLSDELRKSDIFVLPSYYEGLPLVILEAMACGNYIITSDIKGISKWLGEEINNTGMIDYIELPKMKDIGVPLDEEIHLYQDRIKKSLIKAIEYRKKYRNEYVDVEKLSWENLAEKLMKKIKYQ